MHRGLLMRCFPLSGSGSHWMRGWICSLYQKVPGDAQGVVLTWQPLGVFEASARTSVDAGAGPAQWLPWVQLLVLMGSQHLIIISWFQPP